MSPEHILAYRERMAITRESLDVEIEGIVAKIDRLSARTRLGTTARHPRWAMGVKFAARSAITRLERIEMQVGRTGVLTPVAVPAADRHRRRDCHSGDTATGTRSPDASCESATRWK